VTTDFRDVYSTVLEKVLGAPSEKILSNWKGRVNALNS